MNRIRPPSILMYSHDGFGLGHLKRNFTIAKKIVQEIPGSQVLLLMGHISVPFHPIPNGIDFLKLPSIIKVNDEQWLPRNLTMDAESLRKMRSALIRQTAEHFIPDVFLVDYVPKGVWGELLPTLTLLKEMGTKIVLGLRDIIDDPEVTRNRWTQGNTYEVMRNFYDKILIYGDQELYDTSYHYGLDGTLKDKLSYCGYLCSEECFEDAAQSRNNLGINEEKLIVITAGGGGDAYPMMCLSLEAISMIHQKFPLKVILVAGPLMETKKRHALMAQAANLPVKVMGSTDGILSLMNAADVLVTMGSYNTLMEAVRLNKPVVVIPREGPSAEQQIRAELFSKKGLVHALDSPATLQAAQLADAVVHQISHPSNKPHILNMGGLSNAVKHLTECLKVPHEELFIQRS